MHALFGCPQDVDEITKRFFGEFLGDFFVLAKLILGVMLSFDS